MSDTVAPEVDDTGSERTSRRRLAPLVVGVVAVAMAALFAVLLVADPEQDVTARSPLLGNLAPDVQGVNEDGSSFVLSRRKGSWVVLNFFTKTRWERQFKLVQ